MRHDREYFYWIWNLGDGRKECDYFYNNVSRLAKTFGVPRHELALSKQISLLRTPTHTPYRHAVTQSFQELKFSEIHHPLDSPSEDLYIYTHFNEEYDVMAAYWSFDENPVKDATWARNKNTRPVNNPWALRCVASLRYWITNLYRRKS